MNRSAEDAAVVTVRNGSMGSVVVLDGDGNASTDRSGTTTALGRAGRVTLDRLELELATDRNFWLNVTTYESDRKPVRANGSRPGPTSAVTEAAQAFESETGTVSAGYVKVTHNLNESDVSEVTLTFTVSQVHLDSLGVSRDSVKLYRQGPDGWEELPTQFVEESEEEVRFAATTTGFSVFAIGTGASQFQVSDAVLADSTIGVDESADVTATVENRGGFEAATTLRVTADGEEVTSESISVESGESASVTLSFDRPAGEYDVAVEDVSAGTLVVQESDDIMTPEPPDDEGGLPLLIIAALVVLVAIAAGGVVTYRRLDRED